MKSRFSLKNVPSVIFDRDQLFCKFSMPPMFYFDEALGAKFLFSARWLT